MQYDTLNGTITSLEDLKLAVENIKKACNVEILDKTADQWPDVEKYLDEVIKNLDTAIQDYASTYGTPMSSIASKYGD